MRGGASRTGWGNDPQLQTVLEEIEGILAEVTKQEHFVLGYSPGHHKDTSWRCRHRLQYLRAQVLINELRTLISN